MLRFLEGERRRLKAKDLAYRVMVFDPRGMYPSGTFHVENGFFHASEEIAFSVVKGESWEAQDPEVRFSEFDWASPQELRLLASLLLCEKRGDAYVRFYPIVRYGHLLDAEDLDLSSSRIVEKISELLLDLARESKGAPSRPRIERCLDAPYSLVSPDRYAISRLPEFWHHLSSRNYVALRGIYALIKSDMLSCHYEFYEESIISLYISLEASFSLVMRQLRNCGIDNPSAHDAAVWLHEHFDKPFGIPEPDSTERYFHDFYEGRVMTLHPASRYGDSPYAPIMHDDAPHLRRSLREVFAYLVTGTHGNDYAEDLRMHEIRYGPRSGA